MQLNKKIIKLTTIDEKAWLILLENTEIKLLLSDDGTADIEGFFTKLINLLLENPFELDLNTDNNSKQLIEEVAAKYIDRLNIEIENITKSPEYKLFSKKDHA